MEHLERSIAEGLLSIRAVFFRPNEPFTWASGIKSPVYCDNRLILTAPEVRTQVESALCEIIRADYPDVEVLMGTSTAGIAHAAIVGHMMGLPMGYVRSSSKDHGRQNQIEGRLEPGQKVVVIEDLISTGGSVLDVVNVLREAGAEVLGVASIFTYGMQKGLDRLAAETEHRGLKAQARAGRGLKEERCEDLAVALVCVGVGMVDDVVGYGDHIVDLLGGQLQNVDQMLHVSSFLRSKIHPTGRCGTE